MRNAPFTDLIKDVLAELAGRSAPVDWGTLEGSLRFTLENMRDGQRHQYGAPMRARLKSLLRHGYVDKFNGPINQTVTVDYPCCKQYNGLGQWDEDSEKYVIRTDHGDHEQEWKTRTYERSVETSFWFITDKGLEYYEAHKDGPTVSNGGTWNDRW